MEKLTLAIFVVVTLSYVRGINLGTPIDIFNYPYVVSLQQITGPGVTPPAHRNHVCGGVLITFAHVLTSATCCFEYNAQTDVYTPKVPNSYRVFAGATQLTDDLPDRWRQIQVFTPHPEYVRPPSHLNDIGIITLQVRFANNIGIVPINVTNTIPNEETACTVAGWGANTETNLPSTQLRYASKYVYSQQLCTLIYTVLAPQRLNIFSHMLCSASFDVRVTSGIYDDGNILVCGENVPVGVLTYYSGPGEMSYPEVYTRVSNYTQWIASITGSANVAMPGMFILILAAVLNVFLFSN